MDRDKGRIRPYKRRSFQREVWEDHIFRDILQWDPNRKCQCWHFLLGSFGSVCLPSELVSGLNSSSHMRDQHGLLFGTVTFRVVHSFRSNFRFCHLKFYFNLNWALQNHFPLQRFFLLYCFLFSPSLSYPLFSLPLSFPFFSFLLSCPLFSSPARSSPLFKVI